MQAVLFLGLCVSVCVRVSLLSLQTEGVLLQKFHHQLEKQMPLTCSDAPLETVSFCFCPLIMHIHTCISFFGGECRSELPLFLSSQACLVWIFRKQLTKQNW